MSLGKPWEPKFRNRTPHGSVYNGWVWTGRWCMMYYRDQALRDEARDAINDYENSY